MSHLGPRLAAYLDGELPRGTRELVSAHLGLCASCRVALAAEARTKDGLTGLSTPDPPLGLMSSLLELAAPGEPMPPRRRPLGEAPRVPAVPVRPSVLRAAPSPPPAPVPARRSALRSRGSLVAAGALGVAAVAFASASVDGRPAETGPTVDPAEAFAAATAAAGEQLRSENQAGSAAYATRYSPGTFRTVGVTSAAVIRPAGRTGR